MSFENSTQMEGIIYIATNLINKKQYVGQTTRGLQERMRKHFYTNRCPKFHNALKFYGKENFKWFFFEWPMDDLDYPEVFWQTTLNTLTPNGYNLITCGNKNKKFSEESKKKMSDAHKGIPLSEETKRKMSEVQKGKVLSNETKKKISDSRKGIVYSVETIKKMKEAKMGEKNSRFGKKHTIETRRKMSKSRKGIVYSAETKRKMAISQTGKRHSEETKQKMSVSQKNRWTR